MARRPDEDTYDARPASPFRRRLRTIIIGVLLILVIGAAGYGLRKALQARSPTALREKYLNDARSFSRAGKHAEALRMLREARKTSPDDPDIRQSIVRTRLLLGDIRGAIEELETYLQSAPDDVGNSLVLGRLYLASKNIYRAKEIAAEILRRNPRNVPALALQAQCYAAEG